MNSILCILVALCYVTTVVHGIAKIKCFATDSYSGRRQRIYNIAIGHDWGGYEYINEGGALSGFNHDLIKEVCAAAGVDCRTIWEPYTNCVVSKPGQPMRGGVGLLDGWYDACMGYAASVSRAAFFKFGQAYLKQSRAGFFVRKGDKSFNPKDFKDKTIGFMDGWVDDEKCLVRRTSVVLPAVQIKHYKLTTELVEALANKQIDAAFAGENVLRDDFEHVGDWYTCRLSGESVMTRKDSKFAAVWNEGLQKLVSSGRFKKLCEEAEKKHDADAKGYPIRCAT